VMFSDGFNGTAGWHQDNRGLAIRTGPELAKLRRYAQFALPLTLRGLYRTMVPERTERIGAANNYVLAAIPLDGPAERLLFDVATGLLVRITWVVETPLGDLPKQIDFEDYRRIDGIMLPFVIRESDADFISAQTFTEIRHDVSIDDKLFERSDVSR